MAARLIWQQITQCIHRTVLHFVVVYPISNARHKVCDGPDKHVTHVTTLAMNGTTPHVIQLIEALIRK